MTSPDVDLEGCSGAACAHDRPVVQLSSILGGRTGKRSVLADCHQWGQFFLEVLEAADSSIDAYLFKEAAEAKGWDGRWPELVDYDSMDKHSPPLDGWDLKVFPCEMEETFGPQWQLIVDLLRRAPELTDAQFERILYPHYDMDSLYRFIVDSVSDAHGTMSEAFAAWRVLLVVAKVAGEALAADRPLALGKGWNEVGSWERRNLLSFVAAVAYKDILERTEAGAKVYEAAIEEWLGVAPDFDA